MLIEQYFQKCTLLEKTRAPDGEGSFITVWNDGITFDAAITINSTMEAQIALAQGVTSVYNVITPKNVTLDYNDVFRDASGKTYRVTSEGGEEFTPPMSSLALAKVSAEKWRLT